MTQLNIDIELMPILFRSAFVVLLVVVMFAMRDEEKKGVERMKD